MHGVKGRSQIKWGEREDELSGRYQGVSQLGTHLLRFTERSSTAGTKPLFPPRQLRCLGGLCQRSYPPCLPPGENEEKAAVQFQWERGEQLSDWLTQGTHGQRGSAGADRNWAEWWLGGLGWLWPLCLLTELQLQERSGRMRAGH